MNFAPIARILLRYLVGAAFFMGPEIGERLAADPDVVSTAALGLGLLVEGSYALAKRKGWKT